MGVESGLASGSGHSGVKGRQRQSQVRASVRIRVHVKLRVMVKSRVRVGAGMRLGCER